MAEPYKFRPHPRLKKQSLKLERDEFKEFGQLTGQKAPTRKGFISLLENPYLAGTDNHPLKSDLAGVRALSFGRKRQWRLIFRVIESDVEVFGLFIGKHGQGQKDVYRMAAQAIKKEK